MKRNSTFLAKALTLLFVALFSLTGARAQEDLTVCDGTATNKYIPVYAYSGDTDGTTSEFVIPADELTEMIGGTISQMTFYLSNSASKTWTAVYKVYLAEASETTLSSTVGPDACTVVYTGTVDGSGSTMVITFDDSYTYNGGNLLVGTYVETSGAWDGSGMYYGVEATSAAYLSGSWGGYDDGVVNFIPKTTFTYTPGSGVVYYKPKNLTMGEITTTSAAISWTAPAENVTGYIYQYKKATDGDDAWSAEQTVTSPSVNLTNLVVSTAYNFRVKAVYADNGESGYATINFNTDCDVVALPFTEGFEYGIPCWTLINESTANASGFGVYDGAAQTGNKCFRFSSYSKDNTSYNQYLISPEFDGTKAVSVVFYYKTYQYGTETFKVGYSTTTNDPSAFTWGDEVSDQTTEWTEYTAAFPVGTKYVAMYYCSDYQYYLYVDDFSFSVDNGLLKPSELAASHVTATSANISWTGNADSYNLRYGQTGEAKSQDFEESSLGEWTTIDADGDGYGWVLGSNVGGVYLQEGASLAGNGYNDSQDLIVSGSFSNVDGVGALTPDNYLVSPKVKLGGSISFWAKGQDANYPSEVFGVAVSTTDNTNASSFTMVGANKTATGNWVQYTFNLSAYSGEGYVAIRHYNVSDQFMLDIDDIVITEPADNWTEISGITTNSYELTGLTPETSYQVQVQAVYAGGESEWVGINFTTASATSTPTDLAVTDVKATSATLDWAGSQENYNLQYREALPIDPSAPATIIFTADDVWGDGSGYQMLLDADATAYGNEIPTSGAYTAEDYSAFEYILPEGAECDMNATNVVCGSSVTLEIPAGTYDWCITNPTPGDKIYLASGNGNIGGRYDDYVFEAGKTYEFHVYFGGQYDATDVTITIPMSEWTVVENVTAPYEFTGLTPETYYEWQVQGNLSDDTTEWSELSSFTTPVLSTIPVTISSVGYSTLYYGTLNLQVPAGVTASTYSYADSKIQVSKTYNEDEVIPAGTGVVLEASAGTYDFVVTTEAGEADENNALKGSDEEALTEGGDVYYALSTKDGANIGFYWMAEGGAAFTNGAHKAYLALTNTRVKGFAIGLEDDATAIETIANGQQTTEGAIYNVAGQRLNKAQKGVNIVNGKKIAIK